MKERSVCCKVVVNFVYIELPFYEEEKEKFDTKKHSHIVDKKLSVPAVFFSYFSVPN